MTGRRRVGQLVCRKRLSSQRWGVCQMKPRMSSSYSLALITPMTDIETFLVSKMVLTKVFPKQLSWMRRRRVMVWGEVGAGHSWENLNVSEETRWERRRCPSFSPYKFSEGTPSWRHLTPKPCWCSSLAKDLTTKHGFCNRFILMSKQIQNK